MENKHNSDTYIRKPLRYEGYDYSKAGLYFITICTQNHVCLFGDIVDDKMILNDAGRMVNKWYSKLDSKFKGVKSYDMVIMPNHFHCVIEIRGVKDEGAKSSLNEIIQWFKTMSTNEYIRGVKQLGWTRFEGKLWQRSYWDHIIRNQKSYDSISEYIYYNPMNWTNDELYKP